MSISDDSAEKGSGRGCLIAVAVAAAVVVAVGALISSAQKAARRGFERKQAEHRTEFFEKVKAGDDGNGIFVFLDRRLIELLADDADCIANLTTLNLSSVDLDGPQTAAAAKLVNVKKVVFYDCKGADHLLTAMRGSPSVEELYFEVSSVSDDGVRLIATFPNLKKVHFEQVIDQQRENLLRTTLPGVEVEIPFPESKEP